MSIRYATLIRIVAGFAIVSAAGAAYFIPSQIQTSGFTQTPAAGQPAPGLPAPFALWPKGQKPDAVIVLTGQTWGYLRPCGCSEHQLGGLERRANLIESLKKKGWPVAAVDLGDVPSPTGLPDQVVLKYKTAMTAMKQMGYLAVGVGLEEFRQNFDNLTGSFSLQPGNEKPTLLAANLIRKGAKGLVDSFPTGPNTPPYVQSAIVETIGSAPAGIVGFVGSIESTNATKAELAKITKEFELQGNAEAISNAIKVLDADPKKPGLKVLLFQGSFEAATKAAEAFPQFQLVMCLSDDANPPMFPDRVNNGKTAIVRVGHKGQHAGIAGAFRQTDGSYKIEYQLIDMTEDYLTPKDAAIEAKDPILKLLQSYSDEVKSSKFLEEAVKKKSPHNAQILYRGGKLNYVGADACKSCHPQEHAIWAKTKHSDALTYLEPKHAFRPTGRNFDPECVTCHVVGLEFTSGFESVENTPKLMHVGCENCHGPGSGHAANSNDKDLLKLLSPWKTNAKDHLPNKDLLTQIGKTEKLSRNALEAKMTLQERIVVQNVIKMCMGCHDPENDPKFDLFEYMPKMWHSGFKPGVGGGLPPGLPLGVGK